MGCATALRWWWIAPDEQPRIASATLAPLMRLADEPAWQAALVDERHQEARWGLDADTARRREAVRRDLEQAVQLVRLLDG